jgi:hypothetical protein
MATVSPPAKRAQRSKTAANAPAENISDSNFAPAAAQTDPSRRYSMIAEAAYYRAERRGFVPGYELEDWLQSEHEVETQIRVHSLEKTDADSAELH